MKKRSEIGSEFWEAPSQKKRNALFPESTRWFLSGRSALGYVIRDIKDKKGIKTVAMPSWCCDSMIYPFLEELISVRFYPVSVGAGKLVCDISQVRDCDAIVVMDYFGYSSDINYSDFAGTVIRDLTHSVFSGQQMDANYYFGSLRKWCGIVTGGFAYGKDVFSDNIAVQEPSTRYLSLRSSAMEEKAAYINGLSNSKDYLSMFSEAEFELEKSDKIASSTENDVAIVQRLDINFIKERRRENAKMLLRDLSQFAIFPQVKENDCPLFVPILIPGGKRDSLRHYLIQKEIFCPVHWPVSSVHVLDGQTRKIYDEELSIVCDQRYDATDMKRICQEIQNFMQE